MVRASSRPAPGKKTGNKKAKRQTPLSLAHLDAENVTGAWEYLCMVSFHNLPFVFSIITPAGQ
jgi:hypothetical protein